MLGNGRWPLAAGAAAVAAAAASLALPFAPAYDPWAWLVWGRELASLELDTTAGPSWKPLPAFLAAPMSAFGDAAPDLWLLISRAGWIAAVALVWFLAAELSPRGQKALAGAAAALGLVLLGDEYTPWLRQFAVGLAEPLLVALCLLAIARALARRPGQAIAAGALACLIRPEAWPFLAAYGLWACRRDPRLRLPAALAGAIVLAAWFAPDVLGAGNPLEGADRARGLDGGSAGDALAVLERAFELVPPVLWPLAAFGAAAPGPRRRERLVLGLGCLAWIVLVAAMATVGFAGLPRFMAPAAAVACALGGAGAALAVRGVASRRSPASRARVAFALAALALIAATMAPRMADLPAEYSEAERRGGVSDALARTADEAGPPSPGCGPVAVEDPLAVTALAWRLDLPLAGVSFASRPPPAAGLAFANDVGQWTLRQEDGLGPAVAAAGSWTAFRPCDVQASAPSSTHSGSCVARIAGVTGASRYGCSGASSW